MKRDSTPRKSIPPEEALERYDCNKATRGRHAHRFPKGAHAVVIAPELWRHFGTADAVNDGLRVLLKVATLAKTGGSQKRLKARNRRKVA
ncbi:MAG: hypothetical protein HXY51_02215 [Nitrospirae bacterium]|nr:hypothetical protein [Nitrospirota bacterium]